MGEQALFNCRIFNKIKLTFKIDWPPYYEYDIDNGNTQALSFIMVNTFPLTKISKQPLLLIFSIFFLDASEYLKFYHIKEWIFSGINFIV